MPQDKAGLRARFQAYRASLDPLAYQEHSAAILARLSNLPEVEAATTLHIYWPMTERGEVDTRPLIRALHEAQKQIVLPVVVNFGRKAQEAPRLQHVRYMGETSLQPNRWGIYEPVEKTTAPLDALDLVVVPALGVGRNGYRIGHGFGYYDEFLSQIQIPTICPVYAACLVPTVPAEAHDIPCSILVTEHEVIRVPVM